MLGEGKEAIKIFKYQFSFNLNAKKKNNNNKNEFLPYILSFRHKSVQPK